jgi:hypothetical protein
MNNDTPIDLPALEAQRDELKTRADLVLGELVEAKTAMKTAHRNGAARRQYLPPDEMAALEVRVGRLGRQHQQILRELARINSQVKAASRSEQWTPEEKAERLWDKVTRAETFERHFVDVARVMLPPGLFMELQREATKRLLNDTEKPRSGMSGSALPPVAAVPGMRQRAK